VCTHLFTNELTIAIFFLNVYSVIVVKIDLDSEEEALLVAAVVIRRERSEWYRKFFRNRKKQGDFHNLIQGALIYY
jgi:hypothetical protein